MCRHHRRADPLSSRQGRRRVRGLTLVELMLSSALGLIVLVAATVMLMAAGRMRRNQQLLSDANEEARTALRTVARALASAGAGSSMFAFVDTNGAIQHGTAISFKNGVGVPLKDLNGVAVTSPSPQQPDELIVLRYASDRRSELARALGGTTVGITPDPRPYDSSAPHKVVPWIFEKGESAFISNFNKAVLLPLNSNHILSITDINSSSKTVEVDVSPVDFTALAADVSGIAPGAAVFPVQVVRYRLAYVLDQPPPKPPLPLGHTDLVMETLDPRTLTVDPPVVINQVVLARNVEDFQIQWGSDYNDDGLMDGGYSDLGPTPTFLDPSLTFARLSLSVRTNSTLIGDSGALVPSSTSQMTPFEVGLDNGMGGPAASAVTPDGFRRRVMSVVVTLKNVAAKRL